MKRIRVLFLLVCTACLMGGCKKGAVKEVDAGAPVPDYRQLMQQDKVQPPVFEDSGEYQLPVRIYMDNTGSMQAFTFDEKMASNPDEKFLHLMRAFRLMERNYYQTECYTIQQNEKTGGVRGWVEYGPGMFDDFAKADFYFSWVKDHPDGNLNGPLSLLYLGEDGLNPQYINVVMTDLAEQNVNNTQLAQEIQKMCLNYGCDAYLLAFRFDYHGRAQVADPDRMNEIVEKEVHGPRPYYVVITGPSEFMDQYMRGLQKCLAAMELREGSEYYLASSKLDWDDTVLDQEDIVFAETASFDDIKLEKKTGESSGLCKNIIPYENAGDAYGGEKDETLLAFYYEKASGVSRDQNDWRLRFWVPLAQDQARDENYEIEIRCYELMETAGQEETGEKEENGQEDGGVSAEPAGKEWQQVKKAEYRCEAVRKQDDGNGVTGDGAEDEAGDNPGIEMEDYYQIMLSGRPSKELEADNALVIFTIWRTETIPYRIPRWISEFDSGIGEDYFERTYNLLGFYNVLFGYQNMKTKDEKIELRMIYGEVPVLITGLKGGK